MNTAKQKLLARVAALFDGVREEGGPNKGTFVERFQKATDGKAVGEPWCAAFVQYCVGVTDELADAPAPSNIFRTESTQLLWNKTPGAQRVTARPLQTMGPDLIGTVVVWRSDKNPALGHCGIVTGVAPFTTVEGNTGTGDQREGDGVCKKSRPGAAIPGMTLLGFIRPWA